MKKNHEVVVGMSGGVDSAVSAWLLKKQGYRVTGVILKIWEESPSESEKGWGERTCCHVPMVEYLCQKIIGIPYAVVNAELNFKADVVEAFKTSYRSGETPNPCTSCNQKVKLPLLREWAEKHGISNVATGHYTSWRMSDDFRVSGLAMAKDMAKDQSYFLSRTQGISPHNTLFPIGEMTKSDVKELAKSAGFPVEGLLENQEVCFVSEKKMTDFLRETDSGEAPAPWTVQTIAGETLGSVPNAIGLTRGQRRGLTVAGGRRLYVHTISLPEKKIWLSEKSDLFEDSFSIRDPMGPLFNGLWSEAKKVYVRFRSTMAPVACFPVTNDLLRFSLEVASDGIVEGQIAAFYDKENILIGSGVLTRRGESSENHVD